MKNNKDPDQFFEIFFESIEYSYPNKRYNVELRNKNINAAQNLLQFLGIWEENLRLFKVEIADNLVNYDQLKRKAYIDKLHLQLEEMNSSFHYQKQDIDEIYKQFDTSEDYILRNIDIDEAFLEHELRKIFLIDIDEIDTLRNDSSKAKKYEVLNVSPKKMK
jgi:hypothetical protein